MGLAASQAKLLSITTRLSDNELRSQSITAAKLALASQSSEASRKYINALNTNEFIYRTYDEMGNKVYVPLTGSVLTTYGELKNQYGLINTKNQILVSETDAANYKNSANVVEFLQKYGFANEFKEYEYTTLNQGKYNAAMEDYYNAYTEWENNKPKPEDYTTTEVHKYHPRPEPPLLVPDPNWEPSVNPGEGTTGETWSLYEAFMNGTDGGCFTCSSIPASDQYNIVRHFNHVLGHLIGGTDEWEGTFWWDEPMGGLNGTSGNGDIFHKIADALVGKYACGEDGCNETHNHSWQYPEGKFDLTFDCGHEHCDENELVVDKIKRLMNDIGKYAHKIALEETGYSANASMVKASDSDPEWIALKQRYYHIIEHDLKGILEDIQIPIEPEEPPLIHNQDHDDWENEWVEEVITTPNEEAYNEALENYEPEPEEPSQEDYIETRVVQELESDEGRWFIDLWHRMNGMSDYKVTLEGVDNGVHDPNNDGIISGDNVKSPTDGRTLNGEKLWDILEDGLMNSAEWLKYALETGAVSLERVNYTDPTEYGSGLEPLNNTWVSIQYNNALDISEQSNERKIAQAEAEYEQKQREIENKDKQYDSMLKLLDTEHNALQTEYDSIKSVISKNTERTLKIYSA